MRKRRRLADKLTIMVCAVLVAVSAFFYAPIEVDAEENYSYSFSSDVITDVPYGPRHYVRFLRTFYLPSDVVGSLDDNIYYSLDLSYFFNLHFDNSSYFTIENSYIQNINNSNSFVLFGTKSGYDNISFSGNSTYIAKGSDLKSGYRFNILFLSPSYLEGLNINLVFDYNILSCVPISGSDSLSYQQGYNAGYSAGEQAGESNGYSNGYSDGFEAGEQSGYDSGFQAGQDSIDTQSYYDMGYSAGYDAGYLSGYDDGYDYGYDAGWQAYEDKISGWGADTTDYPVLLYDNSLSNLKLFCDVKTGYPQVAYGDYYLPQFNFNVDPNHTYKVVFNSSQYSYTSAYFSGSQRADLVYNMGVLELPWNVGESFSFIQGSSFTSNVRLQCYIYSSISDGSTSGQAVITLNSLNVKVYDYGPSGNTQNHISNQTDQLTGGYNDSQGNSVNNDFSTGLNDFETVEDSLFATATTGMKDFTFFDISSVPAMVTGMSFVGSIMSGWFTQAGGASGVGIVLSILFSIMLVAMVLGLYRWYQSKGGKD